MPRPKNSPQNTEPADPKARRFSRGNLERTDTGCKWERNWKRAFCEENVSADSLNGLHLPSAGERAPERDLVRVLEIPADRQSAREPRHAHAVSKR